MPIYINGKIVVGGGGGGGVPATFEMPTGFLTGLDVSRNVANPLSQVDISAGSCRSDDDTTNIYATGPVTVNLAASGLNGLDVGAEAVSTWYHVWLVANPTTGAYGGLFSLSPTAPTLPVSYTVKRYLGVVYNNAAGDFWLWKVITKGRTREYLYSDENEANIRLITAGPATVWTDLDASNFIPPTSVTGKFNVMHFSAANGVNYVTLRKRGSTTITPNARTYSAPKDSNSSHRHIVETDASQVIQYRNSIAGNATTVWVTGFILLI